MWWWKGSGNYTFDKSYWFIDITHCDYVWKSQHYEITNIYEFQAIDIDEEAN